VEQPIIKRTFSRESKRAAVDRMGAGESPSALSIELSVKRELLYRWKDQGLGTKPVNARVQAKPSRHEKQVARLEQRIVEMQQLLGKQTAELDFFAAALRNVKEPRPKKDVSSVLGSFARSNK
jgi:transposase-like protein